MHAHDGLDGPIGTYRGARLWWALQVLLVRSSTWTQTPPHVRILTTLPIDHYLYWVQSIGYKL